MTADAEFLKGFKKTVRLTLFTAGAIIVLMGVLGILSTVFPAISPAFVMGWGLIVSAANYFVPYITLRAAPLRPKWFFVLAVIDAVFGAIFLVCLFLARFELVLFKLPALVGLWMVFHGCARLYMAYLNRKAHVACWWITLTVCGNAVFAAFTMMRNPSDSFSLFSWIPLVTMGIFIVNEGRKLFGK
ncbi:MAG: DUF308 domain-containing protein [Synergistaceae bacterium]|jgi:hypothetical protein|nr:DUF308 domain-containing protein [Synergistaceae bacterium]